MVAAAVTAASYPAVAAAELVAAAAVGRAAPALATRMSDALPSSTILAGGQIYFTISPPGSVDRIAETGGAVSELASAQGAYSVAVDESWIYFASQGGFYRVARGGGTPEPILA